MGDQEKRDPQELRGTREELLTTQQIADALGWSASSVPKAMHRAGIDTVQGYPARAVRRWLASRPGRSGFYRWHPKRKARGEVTYPRGTCSVCERDDVAVNDAGHAYKHKPAEGVEPGEDGLCLGSWQPVREGSIRQESAR